MKLIAGEVDVVKDDIHKVVCNINAYSNMTLLFFKKDGILFKNVNISGLDSATLQKTWQVMDYTLKFVFDIETEFSFV